MVEDAQTPEGDEGLEPGLGNPRWARYHRMVSAPELWNAKGVGEALAILRAERAAEEAAETPLEQRETRDEHPLDPSP